MRKYKEEILNLLLDKYEKSKSFNGTNIVNQSFSIQLGKVFPEYSDDSKIAEVQAINTAVDELVEKEWITAKIRRNGLLEAVSMRIDALADIYKYLKRKPKKDLHEELLELLSRYQDKNEILNAYCSRQIERIAENKTVEHFTDGLEQYEKVLKAVGAVSDVVDETYERDFSVHLFGDSKQFEKIRSTVVSILYEYGDFAEKETILEELNIVRNPGHVYFKGCGIVVFSGQKVDLSKLDGDIAISSSLLDNVEMITVTGKDVVTIENLTTFNTYIPEDEFVIYLGGYHNTIRREFIKQLYSWNPDIKYFHYGDIDAGGFYILQHLRRKTGVPFASLHMDVSTLKSGLLYAKKLTENDRKRLRKLLGGEFDEVIEYMLENDCKLEQEAFDKFQ